MKNKWKLMLYGVLLIAACRSKSGKVQSFIDGVYVSRAQNEFAVADDTLTFTHTDGTHYHITRSTAYQAIRDGKRLPRKFKLEKIEGDYDPLKDQLYETQTGRVFRFDPDKGTLRLRQAVYRKVN